jgi:colanic acid/amylovoran biosynthesis glycosyltransferase
MKIAIVTNQFPKLSETFITAQVDQLEKRGHQLFIFCSSFDKVLFKACFIKKQQIRIIVIDNMNLLKHIIRNPFAYLQKNRTVCEAFLLAQINSINPTIVHFQFSGIALAYLNILPLIKVRKIVSCRGTAENVTLLENDERKRSLQKAFIYVDAIHCLSEHLKQTILPYCNKKEKIFINYPSINTNLFKRNSIYRNNECIIILSVGRLTFQKGFFYGLLAVKELKQNYNNFKWLIIGDGEQKEELLFHIQQMQLHQQIVLLGAKSNSEVKGYLEKADIFLFPSVTEGMGNVALEAMSMQLPVVATKSGGIQEIIEHGKNGLLAEVYDTKQLSNYLDRLMKDFKLRKSIGEAARNTIILKCNLTHQTNVFEKMYQSTVANK